MSQPITTSVTMDAESFQKFRSFDLFHHQKRWQRPLLFAAILLGSSGICLSQVGVREGASLLAVVLAMVALGLPAVYFYTFFRDLRTTIQKLGLPRPFYRLRLDDAGLFRLDGRRTGQAPAQPPVPAAGPSRGLPHPGRRVPLRPADPSLPCQQRGAGRGVGLPEDASPRLPAAGSAVTPLPPLQTTSPMEPGRRTAVPGLMGLFLRQNDKKADGAMI